MSWENHMKPSDWEKEREGKEKKIPQSKFTTYLSSSLFDSASSVDLASSLAEVEWADDVEEDRVTPCGRKRAMVKTWNALHPVIAAITNLIWRLWYTACKNVTLSNTWECEGYQCYLYLSLYISAYDKICDGSTARYIDRIKDSDRYTVQTRERSLLFSHGVVPTVHNTLSQQHVLSAFYFRFND